MCARQWENDERVEVFKNNFVEGKSTYYTLHCWKTSIGHRTTISYYCFSYIFIFSERMRFRKSLLPLAFFVSITFRFTPRLSSLLQSEIFKTTERRVENKRVYARVHLNASLNTSRIEEQKSHKDRMLATVIESGLKRREKTLIWKCEFKEIQKALKKTSRWEKSDFVIPYDKCDNIMTPQSESVTKAWKEKDFSSGWR